MNNFAPKPDDCTCQYPTLMARNGTGHAFDCPTYSRVIAAWAQDTPPVIEEGLEFQVFRFGFKRGGFDESEVKKCIGTNGVLGWRAVGIMQSLETASLYLIMERKP
jgi:hypothetical protein